MKTLNLLDLFAVTGGFYGTRYNADGRPNAIVGGNINTIPLNPGQYLQGELFPVSSLGTRPKN